MVKGDHDIETKKSSQLNNASITTGNVIANVTGTDAQGATVTKEVTLTVPAGDPTIQEICDSFNNAIKAAGIAGGANFTAADGAISRTGTMDFPDDERTTSNFLGQTGLSSKTTSAALNQTVTLNEMVNYNSSDSLSLKSTTIDENGIVVATYDNGSILTQYVDNTSTIQWKFTTNQGVVISGADVAANSVSIQNSNFVLELATMVNQEGLISQNNNLWEWGPDVGEIYYGMAGEMSFGAIETGGYEGSNVDIASELSNMISAQRMIQMNSRVFSTASSVMETLSYLGQ